MTLRDFLEMVNDVSLDTEMILSIDAEGNRFSPVDTLSLQYVYIPKLKEIKLKELTPAHIKMGYSEEDVDTDKAGIACIILWP